MKKSDLFKLVFNTARLVLPPAVNVSIDHVIDAFKAQPEVPGEERKSVAVAKTISSESIAVLNTLAKDPTFTASPKFQAIVGKLNDAIYQAAKEVAELVDAQDGTVDGKSTK